MRQFTYNSRVTVERCMRYPSFMGKPTRILLVEDHPLIRVGLRFLFDKSEDFTVIAEAVDGEEAVELAERLRPDVIVMDLRMPGLDGIQATRAIRKKWADAKIVMLTLYNSEDEILGALQAGVKGYCLKDTHFDRLVAGIQCVLAGDMWLDSGVAEKLVGVLPPSQVLETMVEVGHEPSLSEREVDVLGLLVQGLSNQEIAERLEISSETVKSHLRHIMRKLAVSDRTQAAVKALKQGLV